MGAASALQSRGGDGLFRGPENAGQRTVFPSTKSAVKVVCGTAPQGWGGREELLVIKSQSKS